jgi:putative photosynthetic complex assembly protein
MSHSSTHSHDMTLPRGPLVALGSLVIATVILVSIYRLTAPAESAFAPTGTIVAERSLRFEDRADGGILVHSGDGTLVRTIEPGADPFLRGALRALVRERRSLAIGAEVPFKLVARANGRLTLLDPSTQRRLDIESFGPTQTAAFARLLDLPQR